eukprot:8239558-Pyramimonas_sp.AAC.1
MLNVWFGPAGPRPGWRRAARRTRPPRPLRPTRGRGAFRRSWVRRGSGGGQEGVRRGIIPAEISNATNSLLSVNVLPVVPHQLPFLPAGDVLVCVQRRQLRFLLAHRRLHLCVQ